MPSSSSTTARAPNAVALAQAGYYTATGALPFVSRSAFERITGPKLEWWLVETVGALVLVSGATLASAALRDRLTPEVTGLAVGSAASLAAIDVVYVARRRISPVYLLDAALELGLIAAWATAGRRRRTRPGG
jgi:hypothetical protein